MSTEFVFLDAGGTLIDPYPSVGEVYAQAGRAHGLDLDAAALQAAFGRAWRGARAREASRLMTFGRDVPATHAFWRSLVFEVLDDVGFEGDGERVFQAFFAAFERADAWTVYADARALVEALGARGIRAGVLSNWDFRLRPLLATLDLAPPLDPVVVSCEEGVGKPSPELYRRAAARVGVAPERIRYAGDHRDLDLEPALEVGFDAFLIDRAGRETGPRVIRSLMELLPPG